MSFLQSLHSTGILFSTSLKGEPKYGSRCSGIFIADAIGVIGRGDVARPPIAWLAAEKYANFA